MALLKDLKVTIGLSKRGLTKLNADLRRTKNNFKRNFGEIASIAKSAGRAILTGVGVGLTAIIKSGADLQKLRVGFRSIMGSAEGAAEMVAKLNKFTASTPFRLEEVSRSARQLIAVGTGVDDVNDRLRMLGDIAAASGNSIGDIAAAFSKVQAKGKVELENLNQLAERGIPIFAELKKVTGDANMEFGAGSVSVEQYNTALANMASDGGFANDAMANLSETISGKFSTAMDNITLAMGQFAEKSGLLEAATNILDDFTKSLQRASVTEADLVSSREEVLALTEKGNTAHKGNADAIREEMKAAVDYALFIKQNLGGVDAEGHFAGAAAMLDAFDEAMAFGTLPDAPAVTATAAPVSTSAEVKQKEKLLEVEKSRLLTMGMAEQMQGTMASDIMAASMANHELKTSMEGVAEAVQLPMDAMVELGNYAANQLPGFFMQAFSALREGGKSFGDFMLNLLEQMVLKLAAMLAAFAALSILFPGSSAVKGGLGSFLGAGMGVPQMADGGMFTGASLAMVGEGAGTSAINPEVVAPLDKLRDMMGGGNVTVTGRLDGRDILISSERAGFDRNRVRGF